MYRDINGMAEVIRNTLSDAHYLLAEARDKLKSDNSPESKKIAREINKLLPDITTLWSRIG